MTQRTPIKRLNRDLRRLCRRLAEKHLQRIFHVLYPDISAFPSEAGLTLVRNDKKDAMDSLWIRFNSNQLCAYRFYPEAEC